MTRYILAIDQGTTSSRAVVFDEALAAVGAAQKEFTQYFPRDGWVEHDPEEVWISAVETARVAVRRAGLAPDDIAAIGITNQRETAVIWDRRTGQPIHPAIVWQDRRTSPVCETLRDGGHGAEVTARTGLLLDPYFSATKIGWLLDNVEGARKRAEQGELAFGTIDTFLIWRLTGGRVHATDATNASRTSLFNIHTGRWDPLLLDLFGVPASLLPSVQDCSASYGMTERSILGAEMLIAGVAGDQQAAGIGQACFAAGMMKSTYGTGCFALLNTGPQAVISKRKLLTTIAYQLGGERTYALEGSIFIAGAAVQWLRDGLGIIQEASDTDRLAKGADLGQSIYFVPAFVGLGAPYWDAEARGALYGITRATTASEIARAALEAVCYQTRDLLDAMRQDWRRTDMETVIRVDGGMAASDWTMQFLADILDAPVDRPMAVETTARGAAYLAGLHIGLCKPPETMMSDWEPGHHFTPRMNPHERNGRLAGWHDAVGRTLTRPAT